MNKNKTPGLDGIPIEFYQTFWLELKNILLNALNECFALGEMSDTQKTGIITMIYKKGDHRNLENWRPISLLNCDYKIMAAILAARLQSVIDQIINPVQTGYIKHRVSAFNIRLTIDFIEYMKRKCLTGALMLADFTKAFDVIDTAFISSSLEKKKNFGQSFQTWVKILYADIRSSVSVN